MNFASLIEKEKNLENIIYDMTKESEELTIEWVYKAIEKTKNNIQAVRDETNARLDKKYGPNHSRDKVFAVPGVHKEVISELVGENIYAAGNYYLQRGVSRTLRSSVVVNDVAKDYKSKRETLKNKIIKLSNKEDIVGFSKIQQQNGKFECTATLESGDRIEIYSITAGGWNIQKFHFRGLAKRLKK